MEAADLETRLMYERGFAGLLIYYTHPAVWNSGTNDVRSIDVISGSRIQNALWGRPFLFKKVKRFRDHAAAESEVDIEAKLNQDAEAEVLFV